MGVVGAAVVAASAVTPWSYGFLETASYPVEWLVWPWGRSDARFWSSLLAGLVALAVLGLASALTGQAVAARRVVGLVVAAAGAQLVADPLAECLQGRCWDLPSAVGPWLAAVGGVLLAVPRGRRGAGLGGGGGRTALLVCGLLLTAVGSGIGGWFWRPVFTLLLGAGVPNPEPGVLVQVSLVAAAVAIAVWPHARVAWPVALPAAFAAVAGLNNSLDVGPLLTLLGTGLLVAGWLVRPAPARDGGAP